jgi:hypothetical protein
MTYKIGITVYDEWNQLFETKIGTNDKKLTLLYSVWGKTKLESKLRAEELAFNLENN